MSAIIALLLPILRGLYRGSIAPSPDGNTAAVCTLLLPRGRSPLLLLFPAETISYVPVLYGSVPLRKPQNSSGKLHTFIIAQSTEAQGISLGFCHSLS